MRLDCRVSAFYYAFFTFIYSKNYERYSASKYTGWRRGVVVSGVRRMNEVNARRAWLETWLGDRLRAGIPSRYEQAK